MAIKDIDQLGGASSIANASRFAVWQAGDSIPERGTTTLLHDNLAVWLGALNHPGYRANTFYATAPVDREIGTAVPAADQLYLYPFRLLRRANINALGVRLIAGGAGSAVKLGLWDSSGGRPSGAPILADNTGGATTAAAVGEVSRPVTLTLVEAGLYWIGQLYTGTMPTLLSVLNTSLTMDPLIGRASLNNNLGVCALSLAETYAGNLPTIASGDTLNEVTTTGIAHVWFKSA